MDFFLTNLGLKFQNSTIYVNIYTYMNANNKILTLPGLISGIPDPVMDVIPIVI